MSRFQTLTPASLSREAFVESLRRHLRTLPLGRREGL